MYEPAIRAVGLGRRYGRRWALARVTFEVPRGQILLVAGANGSGKTTLLRLLAGLCRPTRGSLAVCGSNEGSAWRRSVAMLGHDSYLYGRLTALETVRLWARLLEARPPCPKNQGEEELLNILEDVGLAEAQHRIVQGFSAGMRRRLAMARVRLEAPQLLLLDEPFAALDAAGQHLMERWIERFRAAGNTVVLVSHSLRQSARLCDRALYLRQGQAVWHGEAGELVERLEGRVWAA